MSHTKPLKILIIDDNHLFRESLAVLMEKHRFTVVGKTGHISEALILIEEKQPDIVFLDLVLPEQDSFEIISKIKKEYARISIIACSSLTEEHIISKTLEAGCFDYIFKPLNEERLVQSVEKAGAA